MLKFWRKRQDVMVPVIFIPIIVVFIAWGVERFDNPTGGSAATVNGHAITMHEYRNALQQMINFYGQIFQGNLDEKAIQQYKIREAALQQLVSRELMVQEARTMGVMVPDEEIQDVIVSIPTLQKDGRFSKDNYLSYLKYSGLSAGQFEGDIRKSGIVEKARRLVESASVPSLSEIQKEAQLRSKKIELEYLKVSRDELAKAYPASGAEIDAFAKDPAHAAKIKEYYDLHQYNYNKTEEVKARHILVKAQKGSAEVAAAKEKIQKLAKMANASNFSKLAKENSDDPGSKVKGGDLGYFGRGRMVPEFEKVAFELPVGKISEPVQSDFGFHIILVDDHKKAETVSLNQATPEISKILLGQAKADKMLSELSQKLVQNPEAAAREVTGLDKTLKWQSTGKFSMSDETIPGLGDRPEALEALSQMSKEKPWANRFVSMGDTQYLLHLKSVSDEPVGEIEKISAQLTKEKSRYFAQVWTNSLAEKAKIKTNPKLFGAE